LRHSPSGAWRCWPTARLWAAGAYALSVTTTLAWNGLITGARVIAAIKLSKSHAERLGHRAPDRVGRHRRARWGPRSFGRQCRFTVSITTGIGIGFIVFCVLRLATGRWREVSPALYVVAAVFTFYYLMPALGLGQ
jgi:hypothetical protein